MYHERFTANEGRGLRTSVFEHVVIEQLKCVKCCGCVRFQLSTHGLFSVARAISSFHRCFFGFEQPHSATTAPATIKASLVTLHTPVDVL